MANFLLIFPSEALELPIPGALVAISMLAALLGHSLGWSDIGNHAVRLRDIAEPVGGKSSIDDPRMSLETAFARWWDQAPCYPNGKCETMPCSNGAGTCEVKPLVLVASEGGASRAAFWSALTLGTLEDILPGFHKSVFAMSGVSGGSLGVAVYQNLLRQRHGAPRCSGPGNQAEEGFARCSALFLQNDFLSPVLARMLYTDVIADLLPGTLFNDRAEALETEWERAWDKVFGVSEPGLGADLVVRQRADAQSDAWLPILLLNGASEKSGRRIITSDVAVASCHETQSLACGKSACEKEADFPDSADFFCLTKRKIRLSTAAHNSARFPYVSPPGLILHPTSDDPTRVEPVDRVLDGGYFETLGAITLSDLIPRLEAFASDKARPRPVSIVVLVLENDPGPEDGLHTVMQDAVQRLAGVDNFVPDLLGPPVGLAMARSGHGSYARASLERAEQMASSSRPTFISFHVLSRSDAGRKVDPSMSWFLSQRTTNDMLCDWCDGPAQASRVARLKALFPREQRRLLAESLNLDDDPFNANLEQVCSKLPRKCGPPAH